MIEFDFQNYEEIEIPEVEVLPKPEFGYVYFLFNLGCLIYIGRTANIVQRLLAHKKEKIFDRCVAKKYHVSELPQRERQAIRKYKPIQNSVEWFQKGLNKD